MPIVVLSELWQLPNNLKVQRRRVAKNWSLRRRRRCQQLLFKVNKLKDKNLLVLVSKAAMIVVFSPQIMMEMRIRRVLQVMQSPQTIMMSLLGGTSLMKRWNL